MFYKTSRLSSKLFEQGYAKDDCLKLAWKFYGLYRELIKKYEVTLSWMLKEFWSVMIYTDTLHRSDFTLNHDLIAEQGLLPNY